MVTMLVLGGFTIWRAAVTAWRPVPDRFYFFPNDSWLGSVDRDWLGGWLRIIDRSWLNDFLLGPGTVACFFVAFTALYATDALFHQDPGSIFQPLRTVGSSCLSADHKRLMKIILYGLLIRALIAGWGEEVGIFASSLIFDPWDLTAELGGVVWGAWLVHSLSYPLFSKSPSFPPDPETTQHGNLRSRFGIDTLSVIVTGFYIVIVDPFELRPLTLTERQILALELAVVFVGFRAGMKHGLNPPSDSVRIRPLLDTSR